MKETFINTPEDMQWLRDVHFPKLPLKYKSAVIFGNEDSPSQIQLFEDADPSLSDKYLRVIAKGAGWMVEQINPAKMGQTKGKKKGPTAPPDAFTRAYIETALWSSTDGDGEPLDKNFGPEDISPETLKQSIKDCDKFQRENWDDISSNLERAGHDFWLTRNRHGAGFWDGDWGDAGDRLTKAAHKFREIYLYIGNDGLIYGGL